MNPEVDPAFLRFLVEEAALSADDLDRVQEARKGGTAALREAVCRMGLLSEESFQRRLATFSGLPFHDLSRDAPSAEALALLDGTLCRRYGLLPVACDEQGLLLVAAEPVRGEALDDLGFLLLPRALRFALGCPSRILHEIERLYPAEPAPAEEEDVSPVVRKVQELLQEAASSGAGEVHLEPTEDGYRVLFRTGRETREAAPIPRLLRRGMAARIKILADLDIAERRRPQTGRLQVTAPGLEGTYQVCTLPTSLGEERIVLLREEAPAPPATLDVLPLPPDLVALLRARLSPSGKILIVAGPPGAGVADLLHACLLELRDPRRVLLAAEAPGRTRVPGASQLEARPAEGFPLSAAVRACLRQRPDVLLVDPVADAETAEAALTAASRGVFVLAGMEAPRAADALRAFARWCPHPYGAASRVGEVAALRRLRRLCPACRRPDPRAQELRRRFGLRGAGPFRATGCDACAGTGYRGTAQVGELLVPEAGLKEALFEDVGGSAFRERAAGFLRPELRSAALEMVRDGETSIEEFLAEIGER